VSEPFITPSLYKSANLQDKSKPKQWELVVRQLLKLLERTVSGIMDEWSFCAYQSTEAASAGKLDLAMARHGLHKQAGPIADHRFGQPTQP